MLDDVPRFRLQPQRKRRRKVPTHQCRGGGEPAKRRLRKHSPKRCTGGQRNSGPRAPCTNCRGKPCNNGITGAPSKIKEERAS